MNQTVISVISPLPVHEPRGARLAAFVADFAATRMQRMAHALAGAGRSLWRALEAEGRRRAERELRNRGLSLAVLEAANVRKMADHLERTDPGFAADLRAAASRHEMEHGVA